MSDFANGAVSATDGSEFTQQLTNQKTAYLALYNVGVYAQDEWQITQRLKLTAGIRFDRTGNPLCTNNCFSLYNGTRSSMRASPRRPCTTPGERLISLHPFTSVEKINPQARFGFNYDVTGSGHTVVRGGFGMFTDLYPAGFLDGFIDNLPNVYNATIVSGNVGSAQVPGTAMANALSLVQWRRGRASRTEPAPTHWGIPSPSLRTADLHNRVARVSRIRLTSNSTYRYST